jgi:hypothetical protein
MKPTPSIPYKQLGDEHGRCVDLRSRPFVALGVDSVAALLPPQGTRGGNEKMTFLAFHVPYKFHAFSSTFIFEAPKPSSASRDLHFAQERWTHSAVQAWNGLNWRMAGRRTLSSTTSSRIKRSKSKLPVPNLPDLLHLHEI